MRNEATMALIPSINDTVATMRTNDGTHPNVLRTELSSAYLLT